MEGGLGALPGWPLHLFWPPFHLRSRPAFLREGYQPDVPSWLSPWILISASILVDAKDYQCSQEYNTPPLRGSSAQPGIVHSATVVPWDCLVIIEW